MSLQSYRYNHSIAPSFCDLLFNWDTKASQIHQIVVAYRTVVLNWPSPSESTFKKGLDQSWLCYFWNVNLIANERLSYIIQGQIWVISLICEFTYVLWYRKCSFTKSLTPSEAFSVFLWQMRIKPSLKFMPKAFNHRVTVQTNFFWIALYSNAPW
jgi:hypothetical protein